MMGSIQSANLIKAVDLCLSRGYVAALDWVSIRVLNVSILAAYLRSYNGRE